MGYGKLTIVMDPLSFDSRPALRSPTLVLAFAGWSDAGASATTALRYLVDNLMGKQVRQHRSGRVLRFLPPAAGGPVE